MAGLEGGEDEQPWRRRWVRRGGIVGRTRGERRHSMSGSELSSSLIFLETLLLLPNDDNSRENSRRISALYCVSRY